MPSRWTKELTHFAFSLFGFFHRGSNAKRETSNTCRVFILPTTFFVVGSFCSSFVSLFSSPFSVRLVFNLPFVPPHSSSQTPNLSFFSQSEYSVCLPSIYTTRRSYFSLILSVHCQLNLTRRNSGDPGRIERRGNQ